MSDPVKATVMVVGADGGVGGAVTGTLLDRGFEVIGTVCNEEEAARIRSLHAGVMELRVADLSQASTVESVIPEMLEAHGGGLTGVIVCAGVSPPGPLETASLSLLRNTFEINVVAALAIYQSCMPSLRSSRGKLVFISSSAGRAAFPFLGVYASSKHALEALCDVMRQEAREWGVDVLVFEPGGIRTRMVASTITQIKQQWARLDADTKNLYARQYRRFLGVARAGMAEAMEPGVVATAIVDALQDPKPKPRYVLGHDAIALIEARQSVTDCEMDAMFEAIYAQAEVSASELGS